jgi:hypothetical protein
MDKMKVSEIVERGKEIYERDIRSQVEAQRGKMLAIDINSGEYALGDNSVSALNDLRAKAPDAQPFLMRVGFPTAVQIGAMPTTGQ